MLFRVIVDPQVDTNTDYNQIQVKFELTLFMKNSRNLTGATNAKSGGTCSRSRSSVLSALGVRQTRSIESIASKTQRIGESNDRKQRQNYEIVCVKFFNLTLNQYFNRNKLIQLIQ